MASPSPAAATGQGSAKATGPARARAIVLARVRAIDPAAALALATGLAGVAGLRHRASRRRLADVTMATRRSNSAIAAPRAEVRPAACGKAAATVAAAAVATVVAVAAGAAAGIKGVLV